MTLSCDPNLRGQRSKYFKLRYFSKHYFSYRLSSMAMGLMYIHKLETIYVTECFGQNINLGSFGVTGLTTDVTRLCSDLSTDLVLLSNGASKCY